MNKIYYQSKSLMIIGHTDDLNKMTDIDYFNHKVVSSSILHKAEEVWSYNPQNRSFECVKNRNGKATILMSFLVSKGIHIRPDVAALNNGKPPRFRFEDDKDHFLFQLKF